MQTVFGVLTVAAIMHVAGQLFGAATAKIAGIFWALSPPLLWLPAVLWDTSLSALLLIGMVALALRCVANPGNGLWAAMGGYCGLAMLVNPTLTLALLAVLIWSAWQTHSRPWICWLVLLAVFAPWPLRNARVLHAFIPLRSNFGYEVWQGNHSGASGMFDARLEPLQNKQEYNAYVREGEVVYMRNKSTLAMAYVRAHPGEFMRLSAMRADPLLDRLRIGGELGDRRIARSAHFPARPVGSCVGVEAIENDGPTIPVTNDCLPLALLHHAS